MAEIYALFDPRSKVLDISPAQPDAALAFFLAKLSYECDPADVWHDIEHGITGFTLVDVRSREAYAKAHIPGAVSLPHWEMTPETIRAVAPDPDTVFITYCWGPRCNGATKGAARLAHFGYQVKEMIGGLPGWEAEGLPVEGS